MTRVRGDSCVNCASLRLEIDKIVDCSNFLQRVLEDFEFDVDQPHIGSAFLDDVTQVLESINARIRIRGILGI